MKLNTILKSVAVATSFVAMGVAHAGVIKLDAANTVGVFTFPSTLVDGVSTLRAEVKFTLSNISALGKTATFDVDIKNNSFGQGANLFTGFGVTVVSPDLTGVSDNSSTVTTALNGQFFSPVLDFVGFTGASTFFSGDPAVGVAEGASVPTFTLTLTTNGDFNTNGISFASPYYAKFESVTDAKKVVQVQYDVPEPSSIALTGLLLTGLAASRRLAKRKSA
jgi:hypothetical protein